MVKVRVEYWADSLSVPFLRVSSLGRCGYTISRGCRLSGVFTPRVKPDGYAWVGNYRLHILILEAFTGHRPNNLLALHRNDIKLDNRLRNLYWGTRSDNNTDAWKNGCQVGFTGKRLSRRHKLALYKGNVRYWKKKIKQEVW